MTQYRVDLEVALEGCRVDVGQRIHRDRCDGRFHEGAPVTVVARLRSTGWDVERVYGPQCAPETLDEYRSRDGEGIALVEAELAIVMARQQSWLSLTRADVLEWRASTTPQR
jgi:hypothetical protein